MPTIKDVARAAGVSHGTVSNVLNGVSSVSLDNVKKVQAAITRLGYQPDATARQLKSSLSRDIAVVLPGIKDALYARLYTAISDECENNGFHTDLFLTDEISEKEKRIISLICSRKYAGMIIATCRPGNTAALEELHGGMKTVFIERCVEGLSCNYVGFRNDKTINYAVKKLVEKGCTHIALITGPETYSSEQLCESGYIKGLGDAGSEINPSYIKHTNYNNESSFKAAVELLCMQRPPQGIICTGTPLAEGAAGAVEWACGGDAPYIFTLGEEIWNDNRYPNVTVLPRSYLQMAGAVCGLLFENIQNPAFFEPKSILLNNIKVNIEEEKPKAKSFAGETLRVAMTDGQMPYAVRSLLPNFFGRTGVSVKVDSFEHEKLYDTISDKELAAEYDIFCVDILWLREFAAKGFLADISRFADQELAELTDIPPELHDDFSRYNGSTFAVPFQYCNQLLFYRADLFSEVGLRRMFYDKFKTELKPPRTWSEFNAVARFFTRKYNPESPVEFGTTLGGRFSSAALCEYLPRFWAYGADVFDHRGSVTLNSTGAVKALYNYCESFKYASPFSPQNWWYDEVDEFSSGNAAMMIMYSSYASKIADRSSSNVVGKVSFDTIPGEKPVLGGWSFAVNNASRKTEAAMEFIKWVCSKELAMPVTLLGNLSACRSIYTDNELSALYPWISKTLEIFPQSMRRRLPRTGVMCSTKKYEEIIAGAVHSSIMGEQTPEDALKKAAAELEKLLEN